MEKIALITDTTADLTKEIIDKYNIFVLPFRIIYKDREYRDKFEINSEYVYTHLETEIPTSSMPSLDDMQNLFNKLEKEDYTHAIAVTLSSGLSGIHNGLKLVSKDYPNIKSFIFDSKTISLGEGIIIEECGKLIKQGKSFDSIVSYIPKFKKKIKIFFLVDTLKYLIKGGRIGKVQGTIGSILNIKPVISIDDDGVYYTVDKIRGKKKSLEKIVDIVSEYTKDKKYRLYMMNGYAKEESQNVFNILKDLNSITSSFLGECISPVSGVHSGPGLIGIILLEE